MFGLYKLFILHTSYSIHHTIRYQSSTLLKQWERATSDWQCTIGRPSRHGKLTDYGAWAHPILITGGGQEMRPGDWRTGAWVTGYLWERRRVPGQRGWGHFGTYRLCRTPEMPSDIHAEIRRVHSIAWALTSSVIYHMVSLTRSSNVSLFYSNERLLIYHIAS